MNTIPCESGYKSIAQRLPCDMTPRGYITRTYSASRIERHAESFNESCNPITMTKFLAIPVLLAVLLLSTVGQIQVHAEAGETPPDGPSPSQAQNRSSSQPLRDRCLVTSPNVCIQSQDSPSFGLDTSATYRQSQLLAEIAVEYAALGQYAKATKLIQSIPLLPYQVAAGIELAAQYQAKGQKAQSEEIFEWVMRVVPSLETHAASANPAQTGLEIARHLRRVKQNSRSDRVLAKALQKIAKEDNIYAKQDLLIEAATILAEIGQQDQAKQFFFDALKNAVKISGSGSANEAALAQIFYRVITTCETADALDLARRYEKDYQPSPIVSKYVAFKLAIAGEWNPAKQIADKITDPYHQSISFSWIASELIKKGKVNEAQTSLSEAARIGRSLPDLYFRAIALATAAEFYAELGQPAISTQLFLEAQSSPPGTAGYAPPEELALRMAASGQLAQALELAQKVSKRDRLQARTLSEIAVQYAEQGQLQQAFAIVEQVQDAPEIADMTLARIALTLSEMGQLQQLTQVLDKIRLVSSRSSDSVKPLVLIKVASNYRKLGKTELAAQSLSQALALIQPPDR